MPRAALVTCDSICRAQLQTTSLVRTLVSSCWQLAAIGMAGRIAVYDWHGAAALLFCRFHSCRSTLILTTVLICVVRLC